MTNTRIDGISDIMTAETTKTVVLSAPLIALFSELYTLEFHRAVTSVNLLADRYYSSVKFTNTINNLIKRHILSRSLADVYTERYQKATRHTVVSQHNCC